ncbi:MAG: hypothetical protein ACI81R_003562 [Bradymonadia bacterium]|jgi:hypothetical protein
MRWRFDIAKTWDGERLPRGSHLTVTLTLPCESPDIARVGVRSPFYADSAPETPPGSTRGLWDYEVVELMLLGDGDRYLELEFGPHGHYLALQLAGERNIITVRDTMTYDAQVNGSTWVATAEFPRAWVPDGLRRANAYAIHGEAPDRRYLAWRPTLGDAPDFHRLERFGSLETAHIGRCS